MSERQQRISRRSALQIGAFGVATAAISNTARAVAQEAASGMLTDVPGFLVGHVTHAEPITGCTVIVCPASTVGSVEIRGG